MSEHRSNSAVRNLRSLFENKNGGADASSTPSSEPRGRSPGTLDAEPSGLRRTSKVRASFVSVEPPNASTMAALQPNESTGGRRGSFGEADGNLELKKSISQEVGAGSETAVSSVAATPNLKPKEGILGTPAAAEEKEAENPDKAVTGEQEEPRDMKPADPASEGAVSGGQALPPVAEDLRKDSPTGKKSVVAAAAGKKGQVNGTSSKPAAISTKAPAKPAASSVKSPASVKSPTSSTSASKSAKTDSPKAPSQQPARAPLKKPSRSSLTAPTAASMARSGPVDKAGSSGAAKAKPRETTKPISLPSHLTAPTASSRAKHEPETQAKPTTASTRAPTTTASKPRPSGPAAKPSRSSLAPETQHHRPGSRTSQTSHTRRSVAPADGGFLERMMKPTAASASKTHEKSSVEVKSPPRQKAKGKTNGTAGKTAFVKKAEAGAKRTSEGSDAAAAATASTAAPMPSEVPVEEPHEEEAAAIETAAVEAEPASEEVKVPETTPAPAFTAPATIVEDAAPQEPPTTTTTAIPESLDPTTQGNETPQAAGETAGLEATPAGLGSEETIR